MMRISFHESYVSLRKVAVILILGMVSLNAKAQASDSNPADGTADRKVWVNALTKIATPVVKHLAEGNLKQTMPFESLSSDPDRQEVSRLEALGRTICGIAPWLELGPDSSDEGQLREELIRLSHRGDVRLLLQVAVHEPQRLQGLTVGVKNTKKEGRLLPAFLFVMSADCAGLPLAALQPELLRFVLQEVDLLEQLCADGGGFLAAGGVGLHHGGDLANGLGHLGQRPRLFLNGLGDGGDGLVGLHHQLLGLFQGAGHLAHDGGAPLGGLDGVFNEILGGLGRLV